MERSPRRPPGYRDHVAPFLETVRFAPEGAEPILAPAEMMPDMTMLGLLNNPRRMLCGGSWS